jgi:GTP-binding protein
MPAVFKAHADWSTKIKTRDLNDWLHMAVQRHPPPAVNGRRVKPKYMAQIKARPPTFVLFSSRADQLPDSYRRYLVNSMRESFDLPGVPIRLSVKANKNPYAEGEDGSPPARTPPSFMRRSAPAAVKPEAPVVVVAEPPAAKPKPKAKPGRKSGPRAVSKPGGKPLAKPMPRKPGGRGAGAKGQSRSKPGSKGGFKPTRGRPSSR